MTYLLMISMCIVSITNKRNKICSYLWIIFLTTLATFNYICPDRVFYLRSYRFELLGTRCVTNYEVGYKKWEQLFAALKLNEYVYLFFTFLIIHIILYYVASKFIEEINIFLCIYCLVLFPVNAVQIRNCIAICLEVWAILYLINKRENSVVKFLLLTLLASIFHYSMIIWFGLIIIVYLNSSTLSKMVNIFTILLMVVSYSGILSKVLTNIFPNWTKLNNWTSAHVRFGILIPAFVILCNYIAMRFIYKETKSGGDYYASSFENVVYKLNIISLAIFVPLTYSLSFFRLYRVIWIYNIIFFIRVWKNKKIVNRNICLILLIMGNAVLFYKDSFMYNVWSSIMNGNFVLPVLR